MKFRDLLGQLDRAGLVEHVREPVDPRFDLAQRLRRAEGRPILFENVRAGVTPVAGNLLSRMDRLEEGLSMPRGEWIPRITDALEHPGPVEPGTGDFEYFEPDLDLLPILTHYPHDRGPYVTSGVVVARRGDYRNLSFHRLLRLGRDRLVGRLVERRDLHRIYEEARDHGEDVEVAVLIGASVGVLVAAATSVERTTYELGIAAALEGGIRVVPARSNSTEYPEDTEIVLEGRILHDETADEGPFVDLTNTYDGVRRQPVFAIDRIAMRPHAVYHALLPGDREHRHLMGAPRTPTISRAVREAGIEVVDVVLTEGGSGWLDAVVAIRKSQEDEPRRAIDAAIRGHRSLKKVTIVDADVDARDPTEVNYAVTMYWDAGKEVVLTGVKGSSLDPMATPDGIGSKLGIDATRPLRVSPDRAGKLTRARLADEEARS